MQLPCRTCVVREIVALSRGGSGGSSRVGVGKLALPELERGGHDAQPVVGGPVQAGVFDLGEQAVAAQFGDLAGHARAAAAAALLDSVVGRVRVQPGDEIAVAQPSDGVRAGEHGSEQGGVVGLKGTEPGVAAAVADAGAAQGIERADALTVCDSGRQAVEVAGVGVRPHWK